MDFLCISKPYELKILIYKRVKLTKPIPSCHVDDVYPELCMRYVTKMYKQ